MKSYQIGEQTKAALAELLSRKSTLSSGGIKQRTAPTGQQSGWLRCTSNTPTDGYYPAQLVEFSNLDPVVYDVLAEDQLIQDPEGGSLVLDSYYFGQLQFEDDSGQKWAVTHVQIQAEGCGITFEDNEISVVSDGSTISCTPTIGLSVVENSTNQKVRVSKAGSLTGTRRQINLIEGGNVQITTSDNSGSDRVDVTFSATSGIGSATVPIGQVSGTVPIAQLPLSPGGGSWSIGWIPTYGGGGGTSSIPGYFAPIHPPTTSLPSFLRQPYPPLDTFVPSWTPITLPDLQPTIFPTMGAGQMPIASGSSSFSMLLPGTGTQLLRGGATIPSWGSVDLSTMISGNLPITNQGFLPQSLTANQIPYSNSTSSLAMLAAPTTPTQQYLQAANTGTPSYGFVNLATGTTGTLPASGGGTGQGSFSPLPIYSTNATFEFWHIGTFVATSAPTQAPPLPNQIYLDAFCVKDQMTIDRIACRFGAISSQTNSFCTLGIYNSTSGSDVYPSGAPIWDSGSFSCGTGQVLSNLQPKTFTTNIVLGPGVYHKAFWCTTNFVSGNGANMLQSSGGNPLYGCPSSGIGNSSPCLTKSVTYSVGLPNASSGFAAGTTPPLIIFRRSS